MFDIFNQFKAYLYLVGAAIVAIFIGWFKYRGAKIDSLEEEVENHEAIDKAQDFEADNRAAAARAEALDVKDTTSGTYTI